MTVVYVVLSYRRPAQVLRLVERLAEGPAARVLVRHDPRLEPLERAEVEARGAAWLEDEIDVEWGGASQLELSLRCLRAAAELDPDWVVLLSGQDYPLKPLAEIEAGLAASGADALLGAVWEVPMDARPPPPQEEFFLRCAYRHQRAPRRTPHLPRALRPLVYVRRLPPRVGVRRLRLPYGPGLRCFVASDWLTLGRRGLAAVLGADPRLVRWHRHVAVPTEAFFATVLMNEPSLDVERSHRRYASFAAPGTPHPDVLTARDLDRALASGADFARKFDVDVDATALDLLDERMRPRPPR